MFKRLIILTNIVLLFAVNFGYCEEPRRMLLSEDKLVPQVGECIEDNCVLRESLTAGNWIRQWVDKNHDNECDQLNTWKPIVDPTWGTYYQLFTVEKCGTSI